MWPDIIRYVQDCQKKAKECGYPLWFRGQVNANWPLLSAMHREINEMVNIDPNRAFTEAEQISMLWDEYKTLFHKFKARAVRLLPEHERSDWGLIFAMQHLGLPTCLLDWTESFSCALYFAQQGRTPSDDAAIFMLVPEQLNQETLRNEGLVALGGNANVRTTVDVHQYHPAMSRSTKGDDVEALAIAPELTNARMIAQRSAFILCGTSFQPLEERYPKVIKKVVLPAEDFSAAQEFLDLTGQDHFGLFPDLEGLRDHLRKGLKQEVEQVRKRLSSLPSSAS